jgi:glycolate dehydrogenase FAD-binding subunit
MDLIHPHSSAEVADALRAASGAGTGVRVVGGRQHSVSDTPVDAELWTTLLDHIVAYDPAEMLCVVETGVRLHDLRRALSEGGQEWPVDEPDDATVGGVIGANVALPRQLRVGLLRDTVVEMTFVTSDGRTIRSGARTVKNVTGFDLHRLLTGSRGTLGVITQVALKVRPLAKVVRTLVTREGGVELGERLLAEIPLPGAVIAEHDRVTVRLEGWPAEVAEQATAAGDVAVMADTAPAGFPGVAFPDAPTVARAAVPPSRLGELLDGVERYRALLGVGFAWVPCASAEELSAIRERAHELGGTAPVVRGIGDHDNADAPLIDVQRRIKGAFDPSGILVAG